MTDDKGEWHGGSVREVDYEEDMLSCKRVRLVGGRPLNECDVVPTNVVMAPLKGDRPTGLGMACHHLPVTVFPKGLMSISPNSPRSDISPLPPSLPVMCQSS